MEATVEGLKSLFGDVIRSEFGPTKPVLCKFALELVDAVPAYFWTEAASSSGLHHPTFGLGVGGLARHSLMVYRWLKILMYVSLALGAILVYADVANNLISYGACFIAAAELFVLALLHISFQSRIAKRPLPQFNKKGAGYDEN